MSVVVIWRMTPERHAGTAFTGEGASLYGGRWNLPDVPLVYCAESRALAALEVLANIRSSRLQSAQPWVVIPVEVKEDLIEKPARLPENWRTNPYPVETQRFGTTWAQAGRSVALRVPSVVVPGEFNYLLNPKHSDFAKVKIGKAEPFAFDRRLKS